MHAGLTVSIIVIAVRLMVPFTMLRWPLGGALASALADIYDFVLFEKFGFGIFGNGHYQFYDKVLDTWFLLFALWIVIHWQNSRARRTGIVLFIWRMAGFLVFELTGWRFALILGPNIFENFFFFWLIVLKWFPKFKLTAKNLTISLIFLGIPKLFEEIVLHYLDTGFLGFIRIYLLHSQ